MRNWDYGSNAPYFITICTSHRECFFGSIRNGEMNLTSIGELVVDEWLKTTDIRPDMNIFLDVFVLMPNHFHGIISIGKNRYNNRVMGNDYTHDGCRDAMPGVSKSEPTYTGIRDARHGVSTKTTEHGIIKTNPKNDFGPQIKNLASIIRGFKSSVTINARKIDPDFAWQPRFHDHVIQDYRSYERIRDYIIDNPKNWGSDKFYK